jgi:hypothetical protein
LKATLGRADDNLASDDAEVFDYRGAMRLAQDWIAA